MGCTWPQSSSKNCTAGEEFWGRATRVHKKLALGATVLVLTQRGPTKGRWETSGTIVDVLEHNSYLVKMDGSGRFSKQIGLFLKHMVAHRDVLDTRHPETSSRPEVRMSLRSGKLTGASMRHLDSGQGRNEVYTF